MKNLAAVGLALAVMACPRAPVASAEEDVANEVTELNEDDLDELDPELLYTNTCSLEENLAIAQEREKYGPILIRFQVAISFRNALRNLGEICPKNFPAISALVNNGRPYRWLKAAMGDLWHDQTTSSGVIYENQRVMTIVEAIAGEAEIACRALEEEEDEVRDCQRGLIKEKAEHYPQP